MPGARGGGSAWRRRCFRIWSKAFGGGGVRLRGGGYVGRDKAGEPTPMGDSPALRNASGWQRLCGCLTGDEPTHEEEPGCVDLFRP